MTASICGGIYAGVYCIFSTPCLKYLKYLTHYKCKEILLPISVSLLNLTMRFSYCSDRMAITINH